MKRQNYHRKKFIWGKTLFSTVLTAVLLVNLWAAFPTVSRASGKIVWEQEDVWGGVELDGYQSEQEVSAGQIKIQEKTVDLKSETREGVVYYQADFCYEADDQMLIANLNPYVKTEKGTIIYQGKEYNSSGHYVYPRNRSGDTYYRIITDLNEPYAFADFEDEVRTAFQEDNDNTASRVSEKMLVTDKEGSPAGYAFCDLVQNYMSKKQAKTWNSDTELPLRGVVRIDMITVTYIDHYIRARAVSDDSLYLSRDYDEAVYACYSYEFSGPAVQLEAPVPVLESGTDLSGAGTAPVSVYEDDSVTDIAGNNPGPDNTEITEDYEKIKDQITYRYYFSDSELTSFGNVQWKEWNGTDLPLNRKKYLYVKAKAPTDQQTKLYQFKDSDPVCYEWDYKTEQPGEITADVNSPLVREDAESKDELELSETGGAGIYYTLDETEPIKGKASLSKEERKSLETAAAGASSGAVISSGDKKYIKINQLWYECSETVEKYELGTPIALSYDEDRKVTVTVQAAIDGKAPGNSKVLTYQKLLPPEVFLEDGVTKPENASIAAEDRITLKAPDQNGGKWKYYLDDRSVMSFSDAGWDDCTDEISPQNKYYLYVRTIPENDTQVASKVRVCHISYIAEEPGKVTASVETSTAVSGENLSDKVRFGGIGSQALAFYSFTKTEEPFTAGLDTNLISKLNDLAGEETPASVEYEGSRYVRVNRVWYKCADGVKLYEGNVELPHDQLTGEDGMTLYAWKLEEGKKVSKNAASFKYRKLNPPAVTLESGKSLDQKVEKTDQMVGLKLTDQVDSKVMVTLQYYLSDRKLTSVDRWMTWTGSPVSLDGKKYLYVRVIPKDEDGTMGYTGSIPQEYELQYIEDAPEGVKATAYAGDQVVEGGVDYGDKIVLIRLTTEEEDAMIFYTINKSEPVFTKVDYSKRSVLDGLYDKASASSITLDGKRYVKLNGLWYECGEDTRLYEDKITVDESIYTSNYLIINAQALTEGKIIGSADRFTYSFSLRSQVEAPTANPKDGEAVSMGDSISLYCSTGGSRIFYTLNGSAPVVTLNGTEVVMGKDTYEFKDEPIEITDTIADYGSSLTITAIACSFTSQYGELVRTMKDSELARFVYKITDQPVVESVTSVPATDSENRTIVETGTKIRLYSKTEGVTIFYTTDGSEPVFDETTLEPENSATRKYSGSEGITVPEIGDSSLFTITAVAYKEGLASSAISRLIFSYPSAVSSPYASPAEGSVTENTQVTLKTATDGAVIYYEIAYGGETPKDPTEDSNVFDSDNPFTITKKTTIKAYAVKDGMQSQIVTFTYEVSEKLSTPTPSIETGSVVASGTVIGLKADKDATIYYTVDGSDPKKADNQKVLVGDSVIISGKAGDVVSVRAYAAKTGYSDSEVGYYSYSISSYEGGIFADKETGSTVKNGEIIHLSSDVSGAMIHYTTDGSTPEESSPAGSTVTITGTPGENVIVKAIAIADGTDKAVSAATFTYTIMDRLAAPSASVPDGAVFTEEGAVELTAETGRIYYTTDGTDPTTASSLYKKSITVKESVTIKAIAVADDYEQSEISSFTYGFADQVAAPTANFASGELEMGTEVTFSTETEGASIYYRTDGMEPDPDEKTGLTLYTGPIRVEKAVTFKVIAVKKQMADSKVLTAGYTVREPVVIEEAVEEETIQDSNGTGRLQSRRNFSNAETGPSFTDVVLKNAVYGVVISANEDVLPENVQLLVEQTGTTDASERMVKQMISENYGLVAAYNVTLLSDGQEIQPDGEIEIGLPIPAAYENSIVQAVCLQEDGSVETFETRRSGGQAYIKTNHLSVYAIAAPTEYSEGKKAFPWLPVAYSAAVVLAGIGILLLRRSRKKREDERAE